MEKNAKETERHKILEQRQIKKNHHKLGGKGIRYTRKDLKVGNR